MLIGARPSFSSVLIIVSACRKPAAETLPAASRMIRRPARLARYRQTLCDFVVGLPLALERPEGLRAVEGGLA